MDATTPSADRLIDLKEVKHLTGIKKPTIYSYMRRGKFPKPIKIGKRASRWSYVAVIEWIEQLKEAQ